MLSTTFRDEREEIVRGISEIPDRPGQIDEDTVRGVRDLPPRRDVVDESGEDFSLSGPSVYRKKVSVSGGDLRAVTN